MPPVLLPLLVIFIQFSIVEGIFPGRVLLGAHHDGIRRLSRRQLESVHLLGVPEPVSAFRPLGHVQSQQLGHMGFEAGIEKPDEKTLSLKNRAFSIDILQPFGRIAHPVHQKIFRLVKDAAADGGVGNRPVCAGRNGVLDGGVNFTGKPRSIPNRRAHPHRQTLWPCP